MMLERAAVVDDENRFVRWASRSEIHADRLPHRSVHVMLYDRRGRLVLQRRSAQKQTYPGCWDLSASGHVEEPDYPDPRRPDESLDAVYDAVAHRELEEELGVTCTLTRLGVFGPEPGVHYEHLVLYRGVSDGPYRAQVSEVEHIEAFDPAALLALIDGAAPQTRSLSWLVRWTRDRGDLGPRPNRNQKLIWSRAGMSDQRNDETDPSIALPAARPGRTDASELADSTVPPASSARPSSPSMPPPLPPLPPPPRPPQELSERPESGWSPRRSVLPPVVSRVDAVRAHKDPIASTFAPTGRSKELARASRPPPPLRRDSVPPSHMPKPSEAPPAPGGLNPPQRQRLAQLEKAVEQSRAELSHHRAEIEALRSESRDGASRVQTLTSDVERAMADRSAESLAPRVSELETVRETDASTWEARLGGVVELAETASSRAASLEGRLHRLEEGTEAVRIRMRLERVGHQLQGLEVRMEAMEERVEEVRETIDAARQNRDRLTKLESLFEEMAQDVRERRQASDTEVLHNRVEDLEGLVLKSSEVLDQERAALAAQIERIEKLSASIPPPAPPRAPKKPPDEDLTRIKGIGPKFARQLADAGVATVHQVAAWDDAEVIRMAAALGIKPGRIRKAGWVESANSLVG